MAIKLQPFSVRRTPITVPDMAGQAHAAIFTYDAAAGLASGDVVEIAGLPARARVLDASLSFEGITTVTAEVGFLSGDFQSDDNARAITGTKLFTGAATGTTETQAALTTLAGLTPADAHRGIGVALSGAVTAGAGKKVHLRVVYAM